MKKEIKLAAVFWFYKEPDVCRNKLEVFKKYNPETKIYGLFGGDKKNAILYKEKLGDLLDDFYISSLCDKDGDFKWIHGDVMLLDWYEKRGKNLEWNSVAIIQWDMLVFDSLKRLFHGLKKNQIFLSGLKKLDSETENRWSWTTPKGKHRENFLAFKNYIKKEYKYSPKTYLCCLFIFEILPRKFFESWKNVGDKFIGMLEYKIPSYAEIFHIPFYRKNIGVWWWEKGNFGNLPLNAIPVEIKESYVDSELKKQNGYRIFHPYSKIWNL